MTSKSSDAPASQHALLDDQLCFQLYAASKAVSGAYRVLLQELGLTYPQYLTMLAIWEREGRTVADLSDALDLDSGTLSPLLQRLERAGLIVKARSTHDERVVQIYTTDEGRAMETRATPVRIAVETSTGLSDEAFAALREQLHDLRRTVTGRADAVPAVDTQED
ncbi:MarR family winged helix-turn-helix transcriptional regulator [Plantibacter sp. Mn2098]|uniref:MarR family winged helix-turn-helix transcriptional regulator n=1 Tax=Plantibacter sp. Mn2098 TaxID=3395266 RepID=UPI003BD573D3